MQFEISREYLDQFHNALENRNDELIKSMTEGLHVADISSVLENLNTEDSKYVFELLDTKIGARIISNLDEQYQDFVKVFSSEELASYMVFMDSDDAADILQELKIQMREEVINFLYQKEKEKAKNIKELLYYEEDTAGGLMAKELVKININRTVRECKDQIRKNAENLRKLFTVYVVDDENILVGRVSLRRLLLAEDETVIGDIYWDKIFSVQTYMDEEEVADMMQKYDLEVIPVVDVYGRLQGRITIDDIVDVITEQAEIDQQLMSGISSDIEEDSSVFKLTKARLPWLFIGILGGLLGAYLITFFEEDLIAIPAMASFIPLIMATGGNVGIQSSTLVVQSLASKSNVADGSMSRLLRGLLVALVNGIIIGGLVFGGNLLIGNEIKLCYVVSIALFFVVLLASFLGTITPLTLDKLGINPALASGPFITTSIDLLGIGVYFLIARQLYML